MAVTREGARRCCGVGLRGGRRAGRPRWRVTGGMNTGAVGLRGVRRAGIGRLGLSPLCVRQRRLALSAHAHSTLAKGAHHHRAGLGRKSRHGGEHSGSAAAGATRLVGSVISPRRATHTRVGRLTHSHIFYRLITVGFMVVVPSWQVHGHRRSHHPVDAAPGEGTSLLHHHRHSKGLYIP